MSENALGKASSANGDSGKECFPCPTCGDPFDTKNGRNIHHGQVHGESIAFDTYECYTCGEEFKRRKCETKDVEKPVCSLECRKQVLSEAHSGENNHKYKESRVECTECGAEIEVQPVKLGRQDNCFCDQSCYGDWLSKHNFGKDHHQFKPDKPQSRFYQTERWRRTRAKAIKRDGNECQACEVGTNLCVHHIRPISDGGAKFELNNLVTLCRSCHQRWEGLYLRPDTGGM